MNGTHRATPGADAAVTSYEFVDGIVTRHPEQHFREFVLDGRSLRESAFGGYPLETLTFDQRAGMGEGRVPPADELHTEVARRAIRNPRRKHSR